MAMKSALMERKKIQEDAWEIFQENPRNEGLYANFEDFKADMGSYGEWYYWKTLREFHLVNPVTITEFHGLLICDAEITIDLMNDKGCVLNHNLAWKKGRNYIERVYQTGVDYH